MTSKKIVYTSDFKLQVLDYYFRHGGHENFGLKTKTAVHFNIDKKTINRLLNNQEMVKRARRILARRHAPSTAATTTKPSTSKSSSSASKVTSRPSASSKPSSKVTSTSSSSSSAASKSAKSGKLKSKVVPGKVGGKSGSASGSPQSGSASVASGASKGSGGVPSSSRVPGHGGTEGVKVFELPEDPDYSLLKPSIAASANGVANVAKLLVTGTQEVRKLMLDECEIIFECRVCRSLFRSVVNFLAHKRIYCQKVFADVRTLFHRDNIEGVTNQSGTVIVEPEDPPPTPPPTDLPRPAPAPEVKEESRSQRRIDSIADRLAGRRDGRTGQSEEMFLSHPTQTGSSKYFERLQSINAERDKLSQDCSVVLEDIRGVVNARIQTFSPNSSTEPQPMSEMLQEVSQRSQGVTVALGESGKIIKTVRGEADEMEVDEMEEESGRQTNTEADLICKLCNTHFATAKTKAIHQRSFHGLKRLIYTCPICRATLTNMFGVAKHLEEVHHKTKHQTNRLKKVIRKNAIKHASVSTEEEEDVALGKKEAESAEGAAAERIEGQTEVIGSTNKPAVSRASAVTRNSRASASSPASTTTTTTTTSSTLSTRKSSSTRLSQKAVWHHGSGGGEGASARHPSVAWRCNVCAKTFISRPACLLHIGTHIVCSYEPRAVPVPVPGHIPKTRCSVRMRVPCPPAQDKGGQSDSKLAPKETDDSASVCEGAKLPQGAECHSETSLAPDVRTGSSPEPESAEECHPCPESAEQHLALSPRPDDVQPDQESGTPSLPEEMSVKTEPEIGTHSGTLSLEEDVSVKLEPSTQSGTLPSLPEECVKAELGPQSLEEDVTVKVEPVFGTEGSAISESGTPDTRESAMAECGTITYTRQSAIEPSIGTIPKVSSPGTEHTPITGTHSDSATKARVPADIGTIPAPAVKVPDTSVSSASSANLVPDDIGTQTDSVDRTKLLPMIVPGEGTAGGESANNPTVPEGEKEAVQECQKSCKNSVPDSEMNSSASQCNSDGSDATEGARHDYHSPDSSYSASTDDSLGGTADNLTSGTKFHSVKRKCGTLEGPGCAKRLAVAPNTFQTVPEINAITVPEINATTVPEINSITVPLPLPVPHADYKTLKEQLVAPISPESATGTVPLENTILQDSWHHSRDPDIRSATILAPGSPQVDEMWPLALLSTSDDINLFDPVCDLDPASGTDPQDGADRTSSASSLTSFSGEYSGTVEVMESARGEEESARRDGQCAMEEQEQQSATGERRQDYSAVRESKVESARLEQNMDSAKQEISYSARVGHKDLDSDTGGSTDTEDSASASRECKMESARQEKQFTENARRESRDTYGASAREEYSDSDSATGESTDPEDSAAIEEKKKSPAVPKEIVPNSLLRQIHC